jgi:hypothetical protein
VLELAEQLQRSDLSITIQSQLWLTPALQALHILMIGVVFGGVLLIALRALGLLRADEPFAVVWRQFAPWIVVGLLVMLVTGGVLIVGEPVREVSSISFWVKLALIVLGIAAMWSLRHVVAPAAAAPGAERVVASGKGRVIAIVTLTIWLLVIFFGRAIAYDTEVWGLFGFGA